MNIREVARLAKVSTATVSRVMNGAENVSHNTRSKVLSAISRLNYSPDVHAVELRRGKCSLLEKREIQVPTPAPTGAKPFSDSAARSQNKRRKAERLRLLEDENARLRRLVTNLRMDLEMWRSIAQ